MNFTELITTGLETKNKGSDTKLFVGDWCKNQPSLEKDYDTFNNIWDDRKKMYEDYIFLSKLHKKIITSLSNYLNRIHNKDFSERYWQTLLDPWLFSYLGAVFFRWKTISLILDEDKNYKTTIFKNLTNLPPPLDYDEYRIKIAKSHIYNHAVFARIIFFFKDIRKNIDINLSDRNEFESENLLNKNKNTFLDKLFLFIESIFGFLLKKNQVYIDDTLFFKSFYIKLNLSLFQIPLPSLSSFDWSRIKKNLTLNSNFLKYRKEKIKIDNSESLFESYLFSTIMADLPSTLLEHYESLFLKAEKITLKPRLIITSRKHWTNVIFKFWVAFMQQKGAKVLCACHGGGYGLKMESMNFEDDISDIKVNWYKPYHPKHIQMPAVNLKRIKRNLNPTNVMLVGFENPIYPRRIESTPVSGQSLYLLDHIDIISENLNSKIKEKFFIRPYNDQGWGVAKKLKKKYGKSRIVIGNNYTKYLKNSKILICTYPETSFCEGMYSGPTIIIFDPYLWEIKEKFNELHKLLVEAKIMFYDPFMAANHINDIFDKVDDWWQSDKVINARRMFSEYVSDAPDDSLERWRKLIRNQKHHIKI